MYAYKTEPATIKNLKRGVASMLMMQLKSGKMLEVKSKKIKTESKDELCHTLSSDELNVFHLQADASGKCLVEYKATKDQVIRTKHMETCKKQETGFTTHSPVRGVLNSYLHLMLMYFSETSSLTVSPVTGVGCEREVYFSNSYQSGEWNHQVG